MKKILTIVCCAMVLLSVSSCTKQYITPNPNITVYADLVQSDWKLAEDGKSYVADIKVADLTPNFASIGGTIVSIWYTEANSDEVYEQLPQVYGGTSFSYTYNAGYVSIYAQSVSGLTPVQPTDPITAKIVLVASN